MPLVGGFGDAAIHPTGFVIASTPTGVIPGLDPETYVSCHGLEPMGCSSGLAFGEPKDRLVKPGNDAVGTRRAWKRQGSDGVIHTT